jgi:hypothetical protein
MTTAKDLKKMAELSQLVLDNRLSRLRQVAEARAQSLHQLAAINAPAAPTDLPPMAAGMVSLAYQRWADVRRAELNALIARQTVEWMEAKSVATLAFGRNQALRQLGEAQPKA